MNPYVSNKPNVLRDGYEVVAEKISERCRTGRGLRYCVFVDWEGKVTIRPRYDQKSKPLPDADLIGTYDRHRPLEVIEAHLIERVREFPRHAREASPPTGARQAEGGGDRKGSVERRKGA